MLESDRLLSASTSLPEEAIDRAIRPLSLDEYIGQDAVRTQMRIFIEAARNRQDALDHVLIFGPPGLGKTTLANIIAHEMGVNIKQTSGPVLEKAGDVAAILTNLAVNDLLFIDEIHRLSPVIEEVLYPAMEDYALDIIVGKGPTARTLRIDLERFTIIGATTRLSLLSSPLRDRFGMTHHLNFYEQPDLVKIISRSAKLLGTPVADEAVELLSTRSRSTPRIANRLLRRVRDFAEVRADGSITKDVCQDALNMLHVDNEGLDDVDRRILECIIEKFDGGPVGLSTIAAATGEEIQTIEEIHEPFLLQLGFLTRTPRGRVVTDRAYQHIGFDVPDRGRLL